MRKHVHQGAIEMRQKTLFDEGRGQQWTNTCSWCVHPTRTLGRIHQLEARTEKQQDCEEARRRSPSSPIARTSSRVLSVPMETSDAKTWANQQAEVAPAEGYRA
jgi:hypothetical protein